MDNLNQKADVEHIRKTVLENLRQLSFAPGEHASRERPVGRRTLAEQWHAVFRCLEPNKQGRLWSSCCRLQSAGVPDISLGIIVCAASDVFHLHFAQVCR